MTVGLAAAKSRASMANRSYRHVSPQYSSLDLGSITLTGVRGYGLKIISKQRKSVQKLDLDVNYSDTD